ncbi:hypothetical protein HDU86_004874 [Geranomyces michiganensis]|nr:hypothetical protein HDU86_004874 [Geranomyces michiganensis]
MAAADSNHAKSRANYELRALTAAEVPAFLAHLAATFAPAGAPAALFEDHWHNDPHANLDGVLVAVLPETNQIVSSVRVYHRELNLTTTNNTRSAIPCGAVGDVATNPSHRGKGLARALLALADTHMRNHNLPVAALHAAPLAVPLYESCGYVRAPMRMSTLCCAMNLDATKNPPAWLQWTGSALDLGLARLSALYARFAPAGTLARDDFYWQTWVARGSRDERAQLVRRAIRGEVNGDKNGARFPRQFEAYAFLDVKSWRICEWLAGWVGDGDGNDDNDVSRLPEALEIEVFGYLIASCLHNADPPIQPQQSADPSRSFKFAIPTAFLPRNIINNNQTSLASFHIEQQPDDDTWMFKSLTPVVASKPKRHSSSTTSLSSSSDHDQIEINSTQDLIEALGPDFGFCRTDAY